MDTVKELLGEKLCAEVRVKLGGKGLIIDDGMLIPKHRFDCVNVSLREHKNLVAELRAENAELRVMTAATEAAARECERLRRELRVMELIAAAKPKNYMAVRSNINAGELTGKKLDGSVRRRIAELKKSDPYLFYGQQSYRLVPVGKFAEAETENE